MKEEVKKALRSVAAWAVCAVMALIPFIGGIYAKENAPDGFGQAVGWLCMAEAAGMVVYYIIRQRGKDKGDGEGDGE